MTDQEKTAYHEAAHHVGATHFRLASFPMLTPGGYLAPGSTETMPWAGVCFHDRVRSPFRQAIISWCGVIGAHISGATYEWSPPVPLCSEFLRDWFDMFLQKGFDHLSREDQLGITGDRRQWRSFKTAWRILWRNRARLKSLAAYVLAAAAPPAPETPEERERKAIASAAAALEKNLAALPAADEPNRPGLEAALADLKAGRWPSKGTAEQQPPKPA
jgi:hypothetical protein